MELLEFTKILPIVLSAIAFIVWLIRVEGKVSDTRRRLALVEARQDKTVDELNAKVDKLTTMIHELQLQVAKIVAFEKGKKEK